MTREENTETIRKLIRFLEQRRFDEISELFADNARWIHPFHSGLFPAETVGQKEICISIKTAAANFDEIRFPIDEILPFEDPRRIAVKHSGKLKLNNDSGYYENVYLAIFSFDEHGKILEWTEYYNPITAAKGFGLIDKIR